MERKVDKTSSSLKRPKVKRSAGVLVRRTKMGECDQCGLALRCKNLPGHYAAKQNIFAELWAKRTPGRLIDCTLPVCI